MSYTYAKVWGITENEDGTPDYGYVKINQPNVEPEAIKVFLPDGFKTDDITILTAEEYYRCADDEAEDDEAAQAGKERAE